MTREEYLGIAMKRYNEISALNKVDNFYENEKGFVEIMKALGQEILEKHISSLPGDRRKKNTYSIWANKYSQYSSGQQRH